MRRLLVIYCALFCFGFTVITPEMVKERDNLCEKIRKHYGEKNLTAFVREVVAKHPKVDGAQLEDSKVTDTWSTMDWNPFWHVISGDWAMRAGEQGNNAATIHLFLLFWQCDKDHGIFIRGHREKSGTLVLDTISREPLLEINWR